MSKCVCDINLCTQVDRAFVLFCSEVQIQHFSPWWHPGREVLLFLGDRQLLFPSKTKQDAYCLTLLRKSTEQAEIVTMLCEILPYGVVKHHVFNRPLLEHDGNISFLHLNYISVSLDCCYAVARVICGVYNCNSHNPIALPTFLSVSILFFVGFPIACVFFSWTGGPLESRSRMTGSVIQRCSSEVWTYMPSGLKVSVALTSNLSCNLNA